VKKYPTEHVIVTGGRDIGRRFVKAGFNFWLQSDFVKQGNTLPPIGVHDSEAHGTFIPMQCKQKKKIENWHSALNRLKQHGTSRFYPQ
jgi:hypothetical protein